ncbi:hypothetical protein QBC37DRAFT_7762 [Rhypophila decipiens]|uniref:Uncharacterized protein n=1 Tax=Rhypophila decipiens TaxID=261697 RepID=A0AAN6YK78_9PEZI|nr:hypothetical protein QBC37DRAFT_7762 [Rhypophila decipiens]
MKGMISKLQQLDMRRTDTRGFGVGVGEWGCLLVYTSFLKHTGWVCLYWRYRIQSPFMTVIIFSFLFFPLFLFNTGVQNETHSLFIIPIIVI